jgi:hypothetical protein
MADLADSVHCEVRKNDRSVMILLRRAVLDVRNDAGAHARNAPAGGRS